MLNKEDILLYANLWRKLCKHAEFSGGASFDNDLPYFHLGFVLTDSESIKVFAETYLKIMVGYREPNQFTSLDKVDAMAMCALLNFEEVRYVALNAFAVTTTYSGAYGLRSSVDSARKQLCNPNSLITAINEFGC
jgi:hypothetical protein